MSVRIVSYNVHGCVGLDRRMSPARIAEVLAECRPDIIALQELDVGRSRSGGIDQAHLIASELGMNFHFHPATHVEGEKHGDAVLTALPMHVVKAGPLPGPREPRGAIWVAIRVGGVDVQVINTHFGVTTPERFRHIQALLGPQWLGDPAFSDPSILLGDFNAIPRSLVYRRLTRRLADAQALTPGKARRTFPSRLPMLRIDHVFCSPSIRVLASTVADSKIARKASDHLPLIVDFEVIGHQRSRRPASHHAPASEDEMEPAAV